MSDDKQVNIRGAMLHIQGDPAPETVLALHSIVSAAYKALGLHDLEISRLRAAAAEVGPSEGPADQACAKCSLDGHEAADCDGYRKRSRHLYGVLDAATSIHGALSGSGDPLEHREFWPRLKWLEWRVSDRGWEPGLPGWTTYDAAVRRLALAAVGAGLAHFAESNPAPANPAPVEPREDRTEPPPGTTVGNDHNHEGWWWRAGTYTLLSGFPGRATVTACAWEAFDLLTAPYRERAEAAERSAHRWETEAIHRGDLVNLANARAVEATKAPSAPQADDGTTTMECAGEPGCGQARHVAAWMCLTCEAHRYPYRAPREQSLRGREASAPQGGLDALDVNARQFVLCEAARTYATAYDDLDGTVEESEGELDEAWEALDDAARSWAASPPHGEPERSPNAVESGLIRAVAQDTAKLEALDGLMATMRAGLDGEPALTRSGVVAVGKMLDRLQRVLRRPPHGERPEPAPAYHHCRGCDALTLGIDPAGGEPRCKRFGGEPRTPGPAYVPKVGDRVVVTFGGVVRGFGQGERLGQVMVVTDGLDTVWVRRNDPGLRPTSDEPGEVET